MMGTLSHLHWPIALTFILMCVRVCVFFLSTDHEAEKTPVNRTTAEELPDYLM